jgi:hypothetical protein
MAVDIDNTYQPTDKEYLLLNSMIYNLEKSIDSFYVNDINKSTIEKIYELFKNKNIKALLTLLNK